MRISIALQLLCAVFFLGVYYAHAETIDDLRQKITEKSNEVRELENEIQQFEKQIESVEGQAKTLKSAIQTLDITNRKLDTTIRSTGKKINKTSLTLNALKLEIVDTEKRISQSAQALAENLRVLNDLETRSFIEILLAHRSFSSFWGTLEGLGQFERKVGERLETLGTLREDLQKKRDLSEVEKKNLVSLERELSDQKRIVDSNKKEKQKLLTDTRSKESEFRSLLQDRLARKEALEREIDDFESRLQFEFDPTSLPVSGTRALLWPIQKFKLTQYFGNTPFASKNPQVYRSGSHNGIDLGIPVGTPIFSAASGRVVGTGDTDTQCYKVSYGKWVLVEHENGLSTLYAHLSLINVAEGQHVDSQALLGYSGNTGYSTGPHLHFTVFASRAVQVTNQYRSRICGTYLKLPLSARTGYLNPLSYLPPVPSTVTILDALWRYGTL